MSVLTPDAASSQQEGWNRYLKEKEIDKVFVEIVKSLINAQPDDPIEHMIAFLTSAYPNSAKAIAAAAPAAGAVPVDDDEEEADSDVDDEDDYIDDEVMLAQTKKYNPGKKRGTISAETVTVQEGWTPPVFPKSAEEKADLISVCKQLFFMKELGRKELAIMADAFKKVPFSDGENVIEQGEAGDNFYIMLSGKVDCIVEGVGKVLEVPTPEGRRFFGELALLYNAPRAATCTAVGACEAWMVDRTTFKSILMDTGSKSKLLFQGFVEKVPILSVLDAPQKEQLLDVMKPAEFNANEVIITEGEAGDAFYIVEEGEVVCTKIINGKKTEVSGKLGPGAFFGELALINNAARAATVTATGEVACAKIMRDDFKRVMGSLSEMLKSNNELYAKYALGVQM